MGDDIRSGGNITGESRAEREEEITEETAEQRVDARHGKEKEKTVERTGARYAKGKSVRHRSMCAGRTWEKNVHDHHEILKNP